MSIAALNPEPKLGRASIETLEAALAAVARHGLAKHVQLSTAIIDLVRAGSWQVGDQVPPEQQLSRFLRMSLGTVQKALNRLAVEGWVIREHGRGTFVSYPNRTSQDVWFYRYLDHFCFRDPDTDEPLPVYTTLISRGIVESNGQARTRLGPDAHGFVEIVRRIELGREFSCRSLMYLGATRFGGLLSLPAHAFDNVNLKQIFSEQFGAPTTALVQTVKVAPLSLEDSVFLKVESGSYALILEILARTDSGRPLSYQRILIPHSRYSLDVSPRIAPIAESLVATTSQSFRTWQTTSN
jgi:GntR family transcriptional regulator